MSRQVARRGRANKRRPRLSAGPARTSVVHTSWSAQERVGAGRLVGAPLSPREATRRLALWALCIEAFLLALFVVAPLGGVTLTVSPLARVWPWLLAPARLVFGDALVRASVTPAQGWAQLALLATLLVGASCAAAGAVWVARRVETRHDRRSLWLALGVAAALGLTLTLLPALPSDDIFSYILYGRISALHHANPLITTPASIPHDPFLTLVYWQNTRSVYGP